MPLIMSDLAKTAKSVGKIYSPKFFDDVLTGRGGSTPGFLADRNSPVNIDPNIKTAPYASETVRKRTKNGPMTINRIPLNPIHHCMYDLITHVTRPELDEMKLIGENKTNKLKLYLKMIPHSITIEEVVSTDPQTQTTTKNTSFNMIYQLRMYSVYDASSKTHEFNNNLVLPWTSTNEFFVAYSQNPMTELLTTILPNIFSGNDWTFFDANIIDYLTNYEIYDEVCAMSKIWQTNIDSILSDLFADIVKNNKSSTDNKRNYVSRQLKYIMSYNVPLDLYKQIYTAITQNFAADDVKYICKQNLNLLLSDTLNTLNQSKSSIPCVKVSRIKNVPTINGKPLANEQKAAITSDDPLILVQSGAGTGKACTLDTPVLTPYGWTTMGELKVGDEVVGSNGKPCKVLRIHEQGLKDGYTLHFRDGSSCTVCGEHQWTLQFVNHGIYSSKTMTTDEWIHSKSRNRYFLPTVKPVEYAYGEKTLPINPYFLGALLANGSFQGGTCNYTNSDENVRNQVKTEAAKDEYTMYCKDDTPQSNSHWGFSYPNDGYKTKQLNRKLRELNLSGVKSRERFIPDIYKTASIEQRKALLNGLFDGNGTVHENHGRGVFSTASEQLAEDILQILWSLGLSATKRSWTQKDGTYWAVNLLDYSWNPFVASKYATRVKGPTKHIRRSLASYEPVKQVPMRCIEVDAPDKLYVIKDFIVTHNSSVILSRIEALIEAGVNPHDITVLSFTNAAADHITDKNPNVNSMTIARMIHEIYTANFTGHELSSLDTIANSIEIYYPFKPGRIQPTIAERFQQKIKNLIKSDTNAFTEMNNFIEDNYDEVINILDTIHQTSLELEIIICYQKIETFIEPPNVKSKYLIIDEVQDNSIFEFVYMLKYVSKNKEALFMVGKHDCNCPRKTLLTAGNRHVLYA